MLTYTQFVAEWDGKPIFDNLSSTSPNPSGAQCVNLVNQWCRELGIELFPGNAGDFVFDSHPDCDYTAYVVGGALPGAGDIVVWGKSAVLFWGHVALCNWSSVAQAAVFQQNWPLGSYCHNQLMPWTGVTGWFHPRVLNPPPVDPCADLKTQLAAELAKLKAINQIIGGI
jgi:hypothetical protein